MSLTILVSLCKELVFQLYLKCCRVGRVTDSGVRGPGFNPRAQHLPLAQKPVPYPPVMVETHALNPLIWCKMSPSVESLTCPLNSHSCSRH